MSDLETLLPKKGAEQMKEKQTAETESRQSSFAERKQKCLSMIEDAALDAVADAKRYGAFSVWSAVLTVIRRTTNC